MRPANKRRHHNVTSSLIGWSHTPCTQNDPWFLISVFSFMMKSHENSFCITSFWLHHVERQWWDWVIFTPSHNQCWWVLLICVSVRSSVVSLLCHFWYYYPGALTVSKHHGQFKCLLKSLFKCLLGLRTTKNIKGPHYRPFVRSTWQWIPLTKCQ